jgi:hypothetical protein
MSTRAVYQFYCRATNDLALFYKHHDGYPNGLGGALVRTQSVLFLAQGKDMSVVRKIMLAIGGEELKDQIEADTSDQQHRYNIQLDDGTVDLVHYDWIEDTKNHYILTPEGWKERWVHETE